MSKAISSYMPESQAAVARKREHSQSGGLGYWGARDALKKIADKQKEAKEAA